MPVNNYGKYRTEIKNDCLLMIINFCLLTSAPVVDQLKEVIDEVDGLHSSNNAEDKYKIHKILEESSQMVSILIRCTVILVALHFKVRTVSIIYIIL